MKKLIALLLGLVMILSLCACGDTTSTDAAETKTAAAPEESAEEAASENEGPKTLVIGMDSEPVSLDPSDATGYGSKFVDKAIYETLWRVDYEGNETMLLATGYEWTGDLELTVHLREGVTYANGDPFTADDVFYSLDLAMQDPAAASRFNCINFETSYAPDDYTIVFELNEYNPVLIRNFGDTSSAIYDAEWDGDRTAEMNGTGAYTLADWTQGVGMVLVPNENYWGEAPYYDEITVKYYTDETTRLMAFENGDVDIIIVNSNENISRVKAGDVEGAILETYAFECVEGLGFNSIDFPEFADINVRKAIAHALDVETLVAAICGETCIPATSVLASNSWAYLDTGYYEYDPEYAIECLEAAGYNTTDNRLSIKFRAEDRGNNGAFGEAMQAYLAEVGIDMEVSVGEMAAVNTERVNNQIPMTISGGVGSGDPASMLNSKEPPHNNNLGLWGDEIESLLLQAKAERDQDTRVELYQEIQQMVHDEYLFIPLTEGTVNYVVRENISGLTESLDGECYLGYYSLQS